MKTKKLLSIVFLLLLIVSFASVIPNINATQIPEGAIIKTDNNPDVYIVKYKNGKQFKRLVLNPQVFESYGHLRWEDILIVSQSEMDFFIVSDLVRADGQTDIYQLIPNGDVGTKVLLTSTVGHDLDLVYTINGVDFGNYIALINTGVKLIPIQQTGTSSQGGLQMQSQYMKSEMMDVTAGQKWNKDTKLKYCVKYKSNANYRSTILSASSSLENKYFFQINIYKYPTDYPCTQWAFAERLWDKGKGRGTYSINISPEASFSDKDVFHEICIDDINSQLNHCASKWGISEDDAYLTNIYQVYIASSSGDYAIFDYSKIFVDGNQVSESLFPNQDFSEFSGLAGDDNSDDFVGWTEHSNAYAVDIEE